MVAFLKTIANVDGGKVLIAGNDKVFKGFGSKYTHVRETLVNLQHDSPNTLIMLLDSRDMLLNVQIDKRGDVAQDFAPRLLTYIDKYKKLTEGNPGAVVLSAESQCCVCAMSWAHPSAYFNVSNGKRLQRACNSGEAGCEYLDNENIDLWTDFMVSREFNVTGTVGNSYLNAGMMAGEASKLIDLIDRLDLAEHEDDQAVLSGLYYQFPNEVILDYKNEIFGNNRWPDGLKEGCIYDYPNDGRKTHYLVHKESAESPLLLHTSGEFFECLDYLTDKLGGSSERRYLNFEYGEDTDKSVLALESILENLQQRKSTSRRDYEMDMKKEKFAKIIEEILHRESVA